MNPMTLSWEDWRTVIDVRRAKDLPSMREHADIIERPFCEHQREQRSPD
jgi:hypothetical protein